MSDHEDMDVDNDAELSIEDGEPINAEELNGELAGAAQLSAAEVKKRKQASAALLAAQNAEVSGRARLIKARRDQFLADRPEFNQFMSKGAASVLKKRQTSAAVAAAAAAAAAPAGSASPVARRSRRTEAEEDEELLNAGDQELQLTVLTQQPHCITGQMRPYQLEGLNWLIRLFDQGLNGILADEMGLGKTLQTISLLGYLKEARGMPGPHIVVVPKSTLGNWLREFKKFCPLMRAFILHGTKEEREAIIASRLVPGEFDVCLTSYEVAIREKSALNKFVWQYIVIDEAHRIKNENSVLSQVVRIFNAQNRLLITGTPLQNNLHELWALLNFLLPDVFGSSDTFDAFFDMADETEKEQFVAKLHQVLRPFLLRRLKSEVEKSLPPKEELVLNVDLTPMQKDWYRKLLARDIDAINSNVKGQSRARLLNILMQLRKCCNHPYLFEGAEPGPPFTTDKHIVDNSGKMRLLDKLLVRLKTQGSRVLIFSQMTRMLDILEDYLTWREYGYCRIDGSTHGEERDQAIEDYNMPGSSKFVFLLSTRAGGLGINLATADTVVLFDSDWNPQADLQAMDRAHRIGQTKVVKVYRFAARDTVEKKIIERAKAKLELDAIVIQQGRLQTKNKTLSKDEMLGMIRAGAEKYFHETSEQDTEEQLDAILARGQAETEALNAEMHTTTKSLLSNFSMADPNFDTFVFEGLNYRDQTIIRDKDGAELPQFIEMGKRKVNRVNRSYDINEYYREVLRQERRQGKKKAPLPPNFPTVHEHQFYPPELFDLLERWKWSFRNEHHADFLADYLADIDDMDEAAKAAEKARLLECAPLSEEEMARVNELLQEGFASWTRREFKAFCDACETHGRTSIAAIAKAIESKTEAEVRQYAAVFFERGAAELPNWDKLSAAIAKGEEKLERQASLVDLLRAKVASCPGNPYLTMTFDGRKGTSFSEEEDRYIICKITELGYGEWEALKMAIRSAWEFRFDWFIKSRTAAELQRRCDVLIRSIAREFPSIAKQPKKPAEPASASAASAKKTGSKRTREEAASDDDDDNNNNNDDEVDSGGAGGAGGDEESAGARRSSKRAKRE